METEPDFMKELVKNLLMEKSAKGLNVDSSAAFQVHSDLLKKKKLLRLVYDNWYKNYVQADLDTRHLKPKKMLELGSGVGYSKKFLPELIQSEVIDGLGYEQIINAENIPFEDSSLRCLFLGGVLHHVQNPEAFFQEATRVLASGGKIVMLEPTISPLARIVTKLFHQYEFFDLNSKSWSNTHRGRLTNANLALPWIIFERDSEKFQKAFPKLKLESVEKHTLLSYYASGGMTYRSLVPNFLSEFFFKLDQMSPALNQQLGIMMTMTLTKTT